MWVGMLWQASPPCCLARSLQFVIKYLYMLMPLIQLTISFSGELNISSSQTQKQLPDNNTIQSFLEAYVDNYMGGSTVRYQSILLCVN